MSGLGTRALAGAIGGLAGGVVVSAMIEAAVAAGLDPASDMVQMQRRAEAKAGLPARAPKSASTLGEEVVGHAWHLALSAGLGAIYGACRPRLTHRPVASGAAWGLGFYPVAFWLAGPMSGLTTPPWRERPDLWLRRPTVHLVFGMVTGAAAAAALRRLDNRHT